MQQTEKKYFPKGELDTDSGYFAVAEHSYVNAENVRMLTSDVDGSSSVQAIASTRMLSTPEASVSFMYNGGCEDEENSRLLYFLVDIHSNKHKIMCYSYMNDVIYTMLLSTQVEGGLNLSKDHFIHSARVINGVLHWTENLNEPRRANIDAGIKLNHPSYPTTVAPYIAPLNPEVITIIRRPPNYPLTFEKKKASDLGITINTNQIAQNTFRFTYYFTFRDNEQSTLAAHSLVCPYNYTDDPKKYDLVQLKIPATQLIDQDVQRITLCVIYAAPDQNTAFEIKTWDKASGDDATEIERHNSGASILTYNFTNNDVGNPVDSATLYKLYDSVPLLSETLETADNRVFLGNNLMGYSRPYKTSLAATVGQQVISDGGGGTTTVNGQWSTIWVNIYNSPTDPRGYEDYYFIYAYFPTAIDATHPAGYYDFTADPYNTQAHVAPTLVITDYTWIGATAWDAYQYSQGFDYFSYFGWYPSSFNFAGELFQNGSVTTQGTLTGNTVSYNRTLLKAGSARKIAIVFYDKYMRECGVVLSNSGLLTIPNRDFFFTNYNYSILWTLDNLTAPQIEIPDWAYYYSIVSTKDLTRTWFIQGNASQFSYVSRDAVTGVYTYLGTTAFSNSNLGVAFNIANLVSFGYGYSFAEGDQVITDEAVPITLSIIGQDGDWVICENVDLGTAGTTKAIEIYTPRNQSASEFYYEQGSIYPVLNPTTTSRNYSVITGYIPGDVFLLKSNAGLVPFHIEAMSPSKAHWKEWITNAGRVQIIDTIGQRRLKTAIRWSNTYIEGTRTNGLSSFDALDQKLLPFECGALRKLQLTSKVNNELGVVMLGICERETASMYLGEVQLFGSNAQSTLSQAPNVIGTVNILKGSFGTVNPESVTEFRGEVFWIDTSNGKFIRYSANGLFAISDFKNKRFWKLWCDKFVSTPKATIESFGNRKYVFTVCDPLHNELHVSLPKLSATPPKGYLPDYPSTIYPFDPLDYQAKTMVFKLDLGAGEQPHWQAAMTYCMEGGISLLNKLYSWKYGQLYVHNDVASGYNNFYGVQYLSKIMFAFNKLPNRPKSYNNISLQCNLRPTLTYFRSEDPYEQASDLLDFDYRNLEGVLYAGLYRNKIVPTQSGYVANGLLSAEKMRTTALLTMLQFQVTNTNLDLRFVTIGYIESKGHTT